MFDKLFREEIKSLLLSSLERALARDVNLLLHENRRKFFIDLMDVDLLRLCMRHFIESNNHTRPYDGSKPLFIYLGMDRVPDNHDFSDRLMAEPDLLDSFAAFDRFFEAYFMSLMNVQLDATALDISDKSTKTMMTKNLAIIKEESTLSFMTRELFPLIYESFEKEKKTDFRKEDFIEGLRTAYKKHAFSRWSGTEKVRCPFGKIAADLLATNPQRLESGMIRIEPDKRPGALFMFVLDDVKAVRAGRPLPSRQASPQFFSLKSRQSVSSICSHDL